MKRMGMVHLKTPLILSCVMAFAFSSSVACQKSVTGSKSGTQVIDNPRMPSLPSGASVGLKLEEELVIGRRQGSEPPALSVLSAIQADKDGNIYAIDSKERRIKAFDETGKLLYSFGRIGQGPGEWQRPSQMVIIDPDDLLIWDSGNRKIAYYSLRGDLRKEIPAGKWGLLKVAADRMGHIYADTMIIGPQGPSSDLMKFEPDLKAAETISSKLQKMVPPNVDILPYRFVFSVDGTGRLFWAWTQDYQIQILDNAGKAVLIIKKDYMPVKIKEKDMIDRINRQFGSRGMPPGVRPTWPKYYPPIIYLVADDEGRVFVRTYETDDRGNGIFDVFDSKGQLVDRFAHPDNETLCMVKKNKAYFMIGEDEEGLPLIKRYRLSRKP